MVSVAERILKCHNVGDTLQLTGGASYLEAKCYRDEKARGGAEMGSIIRTRGVGWKIRLGELCRRRRRRRNSVDVRARPRLF